MTISEFVHRSIVHRVSLELILLIQYLIVPRNYILGICLQQIEHPYIEFFMAFDRFRIVKNRCSQVSMFDVHIVEPVSIFGCQQLIEQDLL